MPVYLGYLSEGGMKMTVKQYKEKKLEVLRLKMLRSRAESRCAEIEYDVYKNMDISIDEAKELLCQCRMV